MYVKQVFDCYFRAAVRVTLTENVTLTSWLGLDMEGLGDTECFFKLMKEQRVKAFEALQ